MKTIEISHWDEQQALIKGIWRPMNVVVFRSHTEWVKTPEQKAEEKRRKEQEKAEEKGE